MMSLDVSYSYPCWSSEEVDEEEEEEEDIGDEENIDEELDAKRQEELLIKAFQGEEVALIWGALEEEEEEEEEEDELSDGKSPLASDDNDECELGSIMRSKDAFVLTATEKRAKKINRKKKKSRPKENEWLTWQDNGSIMLLWEDNESLDEEESDKEAMADWIELEDAFDPLASSSLQSRGMGYQWQSFEEIDPRSGKVTSSYLFTTPTDCDNPLVATDGHVSRIVNLSEINDLGYRYADSKMISSERDDQKSPTGEEEEEKSAVSPLSEEGSNDIYTFTKCEMTRVHEDGMALDISKNDAYEPRSPASSTELRTPPPTPISATSKKRKSNLEEILTYRISHLLPPEKLAGVVKIIQASQEPGTKFINEDEDEDEDEMVIDLSSMSQAKLLELYQYVEECLEDVYEKSFSKKKKATIFATVEDNDAEDFAKNSDTLSSSDLPEFVIHTPKRKTKNAEIIVPNASTTKSSGRAHRDKKKNTSHQDQTKSRPLALKSRHHQEPIQSLISPLNKEKDSVSQHIARSASAPSLLRQQHRQQQQQKLFSSSQTREDEDSDEEIDIIGL